MMIRRGPPQRKVFLEADGRTSAGCDPGSGLSEGGLVAMVSGVEWRPKHGKQTVKFTTSSGSVRDTGPRLLSLGDCSNVDRGRVDSGWWRMGGRTWGKSHPIVRKQIWEGSGSDLALVFLCEAVEKRGWPDLHHPQKCLGGMNQPHAASWKMFSTSAELHPSKPQPEV